MFFLKTWPKIFITPLTLFPLFSLRPPNRMHVLQHLVHKRGREKKKIALFRDSINLIPCLILFCSVYPIYNIEASKNFEEKPVNEGAIIS